jgi:hypothetical protein
MVECGASRINCDQCSAPADTQISGRWCHSMTPAMSAGVSEKLCSMTDRAEMVDATVAKPCKRGPYKTTAPENSN